MPCVVNSTSAESSGADSQARTKGSPAEIAPQASRRSAMALGYGAVCHASFALGVGSMMVAMFFGMSRSLGPVSTPWSWIANALLLAQFPLMHSFLLSRRGRKLLGRLGPRGTGGTLSSTSFATIASWQIFLLFACWSPSGTIWWQASGLSLALLTTLYAASWLLLGKAMSDAGLALQTGSLGWVALFRNKKPEYPKMPQQGLFRICRQPIYVAFAFTLWTVPTWSPDQLMVAVVLTAYCLIGPLFKEARFRRMYSSAFDDYSRRVPYWLPWPRKTRISPHGPAGSGTHETGVLG